MCFICVYFFLFFLRKCKVRYSREGKKEREKDTRSRACFISCGILKIGTQSVCINLEESQNCETKRCDR